MWSLYFNRIQVGLPWIASLWPLSFAIVALPSPSKHFTSPKVQKELMFSLGLCYLGPSCAATLQHKLQQHCLFPLVCPLCLARSEDLQHLIFECSFSKSAWEKFFSFSHFNWIFPKSFRDNILHLLVGPLLANTSQILWFNTENSLVWDMVGKKSVDFL